MVLYIVYTSSTLMLIVDVTLHQSWYEYQETCLKEGSSILYQKDTLPQKSSAGRYYWTPIFRTHTVVTGNFLIYLLSCFAYYCMPWSVRYITRLSMHSGQLSNIGFKTLRHLVWKRVSKEIKIQGEFNKGKVNKPDKIKLPIIITQMNGLKTAVTFLTWYRHFSEKK